jgi:hypothetical protein
MRLPKTIHLFAVTAATIWLTACGGGSKTPPPPPPVISVALSSTPPIPTSLVVATTTSLTANVSSDSSNGGVKWSVSCSASACGSFSPTSTASGTATTYTAPTAPPTNPATVTITATSVTDSTKTASATITITPPAPPPISVAFNPAAPTSLVLSATASLTAVVTNDSSNGGVKWTVTCGSSACGSFSPTSTASGTATTYTAPSTIPSPATVTVTATSVTDSTKTATATITITNAPIVLANGTYVYHVSGEDSTGPYFIAGAFTVLNGAITGGEQDFTNRSVGYPQNTLAPATSKLSIAGNNIQIVLDTGNTKIGVSGLETLRGTRVSSSRYLISEFDNFAAASGSLDLQTGTAAPSGAYVFSVGGIDGTQNGFALGMGGVLNISGTTISNTGSVFDSNDGGILGQGLLFSSGSVTAPDSFGRLTFSLTPNTTSVAAFVLTGYIVGPNRIQLVESQADALNADLGGTALAQNTPSGGFTTAGVSGVTYVFSGTGADIYGNAQVAGTFTLNAGGTVSGTIALNDLAYYGTISITTGSYTVDPTGRVTLSNILPSLTGTSTIQAVPFGFQLYLDGNGNAMELGVDTNDLSAGVAYLQTAPTAQLSGSYAVSGQGFGNVNNTSDAWSAVGPVTVASNAVTGSTDYNVFGGAQTSSVSLTGTINSSATPPLALTGLNAASAQTANGYFYFPIDGTRFVAIEGDGQQLGLLVLEGTSP